MFYHSILQKPFQGFQSVKYVKMRPAGICAPMQVLTDNGLKVNRSDTFVFVLAGTFVFLVITKVVFPSLTLYS